MRRTRAYYCHACAGETLEVDPQKIRDFCQRNGIQRLALFGSVLREDFGPHSDIDVLVEFRPGVRTGWRFFEMEAELSEILGRPVDLNTKGFLGPLFNKVEPEAEVVYSAE